MSKVTTNFGELGTTLAGELTKCAKRNRRIVASAMRHLPHKAEREAVDYYPQTGLKGRSGELERSIAGFHREEGTSVTAGLRNRMKYAAAHEFGTGPYIIRPKHGKKLRFVNSAGNAVFADQVNHPGLQPRRFMSYPLRQAGSRMLAQILKEIGFG